MNDNEDDWATLSWQEARAEPQEGPVSFPREALRPAPGGDVHSGNGARFGIDSSCSLALHSLWPSGSLRDSTATCAQ